MPAREHARRLGAATACVWLLTAFGVLLARLAPALAPSTHPHPTLHGTLVMVATLLLTGWTSQAYWLYAAATGLLGIGLLEDDRVPGG